MPITPNIIQTMKQTVNASVLTIRMEMRLRDEVATMPPEADVPWLARPTIRGSVQRAYSAEG
jgi:hypothetical protein